MCYRPCLCCVLFQRLSQRESEVVVGWSEAGSPSHDLSSGSISSIASFASPSSRQVVVQRFHRQQSQRTSNRCQQIHSANELQIGVHSHHGMEEWFDLLTDSSLVSVGGLQGYLDLRQYQYQHHQLEHAILCARERMEETLARMVSWYHSRIGSNLVD